MFISLLFIVFSAIFVRILLTPQDCLSGVGVDYISQGITGRAELRAYYAGTSLGLSGLLFDKKIPNDTKLKAIAYVLGGFVLGRCVNYAKFGKDPEDYSGEVVVAAEIVGLIAALILRSKNSDKKRS